MPSEAVKRRWSKHGSLITIFFMIRVFLLNCFGFFLDEAELNFVGVEGEGEGEVLVMMDMDEG